MKNNKPKYILLDDEFNKDAKSEEEKLDVIADRDITSKCRSV